MRIIRLLLICCFTLPGLATGEEIPLHAWVHDPLIDSVVVSPDGKSLAALTLNDVNQPPVVTIWQTGDLQARPLTYKPKDVKPLFIAWVSDTWLFVVGRQKFDFRLSGSYTKWFRDKFYLVNTECDDCADGQIRDARTILGNKDLLGTSIEALLPFDQDKILIRATTTEFADDLYELNLGNFGARRVYRGSPKNDAVTNPNGKVVGKIALETNSPGARLEFTYQHPTTGEWEHHHTLRAKEREGMQPSAFDPDGKTVYVTDNTGRDKAVIRKYDLLTRQLSEPIFGGDYFEATGVIQSSHISDYGEIIGYSGYGTERVIKYIKPVWETLNNLVEAALPADQVHRLVSISDDFNVIVVESSGTKEPGSFHLLLNQRDLLPLGRAFPELAPEKLSDMEAVAYQARDGLTIPAYLTRPKYGAPPWPAVVLPHGGPWARDFQGWDLWAQFLANRGYIVLQPQYRGSEGWGQKLWRAGDLEWGQAMQDDKDDGAAWLVREGLTEADRIAIYGYSYGGYAAMAAIVRPNSPYQCAISGAGLSELRTFDKITFDNPYGREFQNPTIGGLSPLDHVEDANIPIYIFHGDRDQRVPIEQSRKYYKALKKAGKTVEYNEIPDLWHSLPWWPTHHINVLENIDDYLKNRCGPGGL